MSEINNQERYQIDGLWSMENQFFNQFERVSLPMGGFNLTDCDELFLLIKDHLTNKPTPNPQIVEIGCWTGLSTLLLANAVDKFNGKVTAIDWFQGSENTNLDFAGKYFNIKAIFNENIKQFPFGKRISVIDAKSEDACKSFADESLDVVFLDADHRYIHIKKDIEIWLPKLKKGGLLCGHDCEIVLTNGIETLYDKFCNHDVINVLHLGVCRAVAELGGKKANNSLASGIWYYVKP